MEKELSSPSHEITGGGTSNIDHYCNKFEKIIHDSFPDNKENAQRNSSKGPMSTFLKANARHPNIALLKEVVAAGDRANTHKQVSQISADNWRLFLEKVNRSNTRAIYAYLAKAEGRKYKGTTPEDLTPIKTGEDIITTNRGKCEAIALAFREKLTASGLKKETKVSEHRTKVVANDLPLPPFAEVLKGTHQTVREVEVKKAIKGLPLNKAPGADGIPTRIYKDLPSLVPYVTRICDEIVRSGKIPKVLKRIYLIPLLKVGKDPRKAGPRIPISLICTQKKILETIIYHRLLEKVGKPSPQHNLPTEDGGEQSFFC